MHRARCASKNSFALLAHRARRPRPSRRSHASRTTTRPAIAIQGSRGRDTSASSGVDACDSARRDPARDRRARPPAFRIVFTSHAPLDRLGRLEGGNLAEHGGGGDGRHGDRLVTFLERTNGARRGRGREKERFVRVDLDLSFKHACLVFFSISMYYVLQYEHQPTVLNFGHVGPVETPGSRDRRGPDPRSREDSPLDGSIDLWMDGWMDDMEFGHLGRTKKGDKIVLALAGGCESERRTPDDDDGRSGTRNSRDVARVVAFGDSTSGGTTTTVATTSWTTASTSSCCEETRVCGGSSCTESHSKAKSANCTRRNGRYDSAWRMERRYRPS